MKKLFYLFCAFAVSAGIAFAQPASPPSGWSIKSGSTRALYPAMLKPYVFATLPTGTTNDLVLCTDCTADDDCSSGGGTKVKILVKTATGWVIIGDGSAAGAGDVGSVGDCASGACLDGTSDGGTYVRLYDGNSHYTAIVSSDVTGNVTITLPAATGTLLTQTLASGYAWVGSVGNVATAVDTAGWDKDSSNDYSVGGTDVALADGGTGVSLTDPAAHRLWGWDNTTNAIEWFVIGTGLTYTQATKTLSSTGAGDVTSASNLTTLALVQGDDGAKGVKTSAVTLDANSNIKIGAGAQATQTITGDVSGTDTVLTFGNNIINASTGVLQYGGNTVLTTATSDLTPANFGATQTYSDGDLIDLSPIVISSTTIEGLILPTWGNFNPASKIGHIAWDTASKSLKVYDGGWIGFAAVAAPVDASYLTYGSGDNATLTADVVLAEGLAIDLTASGTPGTNGLLTIAFDPTELTGNRTWAAGGAASVTWTFDNSGSVDPTFTAGDGLFTFNQAVTVTGTLTANGGIVMGTGDGFTVNSVNLLSGDELDGTKIKDADYGDVTISAAGVWSVEDDSHAHGSTTLTLASTNLSDTSALAYLAGAQTFTGNNVFGNADTDTLTIRSMIIGGNSRAVQIAATVATPTYATATNELYVAGDIETPGTVYAAAFNTGPGTDGARAITMTTNTALTPAGDQIYFINDALYFAQAGVQKTPMRLEDTQTATGKKTFQGDIAVGDTSNAGSIDIWDGSANTWTIQTGSQAGDFILVLPTTAGTTGQYLKTTTSSTTATLSWDTPAASADTVGGTGGVQFNAGGVLTSDAGFVFTTATDKLSLGSSGGATTGTLDLYYTGTTYAATLTPNASMGGDVTITMPSYTTTLLGSGANTFTGIQGITAINPADTGADILAMSGTLGAFNGSDVFRGIYLNYTNANHTGTGNTVALVDIPAITGDANSNFYGIRMGNFTGTTGAASEVEYGISLGTGFDRGISTASPVYVGDGTNGTTIGATGNISFAGTATFTTAGATSSVPWVVGSGTATNTAEGTAYWESDTDMLTIGDAVTGISLDFTAGQTYTFPTTTATLARTDAGQTFTGVNVFTAPTFTTSITPTVAGASTIGTTALEFGNVYLTDGAVIYGQADQTATLTSSASKWTANNFTSTGTLSAGAAGFTVDADGDVTAKSLTITRTAGVASYSDFFEIPANGDNYVRVKPADSLAADYTVTLPSATGTLQTTTGSLAANTVPSMAAGDIIYATSGAAIGRLAAGATTEVLVGGGAAAPVWTTATGTGAPVRAGTPTLTTPVIGAATGTSLALGADPAETGVIMLANGAAIGWEDATEATITHVDNVGLKFNLPITLSNDESISNVDNNEITFVGTEAISLQLDTGTANEVRWMNRTTSTTGVTDMSFAALNLVTTGTISGAIPSTTDNNGQTLSAAQQYGYMHWATGAGTTNLVTAVAGMSLCVYSTTAAAVVINPANADIIYLNGVALSAGDSITSASGAGDFVCLVSHEATKWVTMGRSGTWTDTN